MHIEEFNWGAKMTIFNFVRKYTWGDDRRGWGCGYVAIPKDHIAFNNKYYIHVKVNGGITYDKIMSKADIEEFAGREFPDALDCEYRVIGFDTLYKSGDDRWLGEWRLNWTYDKVRYECDKLLDLIKAGEFVLYDYNYNFNNDYLKVKACVKECYKSEQDNHRVWSFCPICGGKIIKEDVKNI